MSKKQLIYTLHDPKTGEFMMKSLCIFRSLTGTDDFQHAVQLHGVEQLDIFLREYPEISDYHVREHEIDISGSHKGTVKELLSMSGIDLPEYDGFQS